MRVDLADLLAKARAALASAKERGARPLGVEGIDDPSDRWIIAPRRDGAVDVVIEATGADVFDRVLPVDARFAVAAQPAVVEALVLRLQELEDMTVMCNADRRATVRAIVHDALRKAATLAARGYNPDFNVIADEATRDICGLEVAP